MDAGADDEVRFEDAVIDDPIVGLAPRPKTDGIKALPQPKEMSPNELREHLISHLPHCDGCPYCKAGRGPNLPHRS